MLNCNSYNIGIDGHHFSIQRIRYETYRRFNAKPSVLLLNTDFISTLAHAADPQYEREQYFPYLKDTALFNAVAEENHFTWLDRYCPLVRYFGYKEDVAHGVESFLGKKHFNDGGMHKGYRGDNWAWGRAIIKIDTLRNVEIDWNVVKELEDFVAASEDEGIQVVFVKAPVLRPLLEQLSDISLTDSIYVSIARRHHVPVLDYYYSSIGLDSTYFYNPSHLNAMGADMFTTELCRDLERVVCLSSCPGG